jgi:signal transduction histidine kinase/DNA-binding response OmpR family regulator
MGLRLLEASPTTTGRGGAVDTEVLIADVRRLAADVTAGRGGSTAATELLMRVHQLGDNFEKLHGRLDQVLQVVTSMTALDFCQKLELHEDDDWLINALAIGLNMMGDELHRRAEALTDTRDRALAANKAKTAFLANMSHELRTPLNAIIGYSELLREECEEVMSPSQLSDLDRIVGAGRHLLSLIKDTLDLSKIEAGKVELTVRPFDVAALVDEVVGTVQTLAESRGNRLIVERGTNLGAMTTDRTKLVQILFNLLSNAIKFTTLGTIRFGVIRNGDGLVFTVQDTGIGIPRDKLDLVFGAFNQADEETTRRFGGTGLGLTITRHFSEMMGGEIDVTSELGAGSTFTLRLPVRLQTGPGAIARRRRGESPRVGSHDLVLVISDDPCMVEVVRQALASRSVPVLPVASSAEGQRLAAQLRPVVIVVDDRCGEPDLGTVLLSFAADPEVAAIPRIVVGQLPTQDFARGATRALPRPLRTGPLLEAMRPYLRAPAPLGDLLVVLGDVACQRLDAETFAARGWHVRSATSVAAVHEQLRAGTPDAVVFDLDIPDAREIAELLRRHPGGRRLAIVGVGDPDIEDPPGEWGWERTAAGVCTAVLPLTTASLGPLLGTLAAQVYAVGAREHHG